MSTERGNYGIVSVHAPFLAIAPNQKSLSNCCMEALSRGPEMKINFIKKYCTYACHTLRVYSPPQVPLRPLSQTFLRIPKQYFVFVSSPKNKPTQSATIVLTLWIYRTEDKLQSCILVWRDSKKRCVHCN